jgi:hypothetical protein
MKHLERDPQAIERKLEFSNKIISLASQIFTRDPGSGLPRGG